MINKELIQLFFSGSFMSIAGILSGILGYVFQVLMGRFLGPIDYSSLVAVTSAYVILSSPLLGLSLVLSRRFAVLQVAQDIREIHRLFRRSLWWISALSATGLILTLGVLLVTSEGMAQMTIWSVLTIAFLLSLSTYTHLSNGYFQGRSYFALMAGSGLMQAVLKIIFTVLLCLVGYGLGGVYVGFVLSVVFVQAACIFYIHLHNRADATVSEPTGDDGETPRTHSLTWRKVFPVMTASLAISILTQFDILIAKWVFSPQDAGVYAAASILGKTILYLPGGFVQTMYPLIAGKFLKQQNDNHIILFTLMITFVPCFIISVIFYLFSSEIVNLFYGNDYAAAGDALKWLGFALIPMALIIIIEHFLIAKDQVIYAYLFVVIAPLQMAIAYFHAQTIADLITVVAASGVFMLLTGAVFIARVLPKTP